VVKLLKDQDKLEDLRERYKDSDTIMSWPEVGKEWIKVLR
jgi:hypothetical protein